MSATKPVNQKAWWFVLPVLVSVAFSALIPLMTVVNYSVQDILSPSQSAAFARSRAQIRARARQLRLGWRRQEPSRERDP